MHRGVTVSPTKLEVTEGGRETYTVVLTSEPTGDVTVEMAVSGDEDVTVSPESLTFTDSNWATARTVTVSADGDVDGDDDAADDHAHGARRRLRGRERGAGGP